MPKADTPYIIGVIREREKSFLGTDEYTRLIGAATYAEAVHVLTETAYGSLEGLSRHQQDIRTWLAGLLADERAVQFLSARADALNAATSLARHASEQDDPGSLSPLGSFSRAALHSTIWHDLAWEALPPLWQTALRAARQPEHTVAQRIALAAGTLHAWYRQLAATPLTKALASLWQERQAAEQRLRPLSQGAAVPEVGTDGEARLAPSRWDRAWDIRMIALLRRARGDVTGVDPILAFWFAKELEAKTIRILLAGKLAGLPAASLQQLVRPSYLRHAQ